MNDVRNAFGFPIVHRLEAARQYAAQAKERNKPDCQCEACKHERLLPAIQQITRNWTGSGTAPALHRVASK